MTVHPRRLIAPLVLSAGVALLVGCLGGTQNTSYFPWLLPTGDVIRTHAKPPGLGYFANFDPHACRLEVRPEEATAPVRCQQVLIATIYDENGKPRRNRRVEWIVQGAGSIVEVDESGYLPGRGYKVDNQYAVSYTDYFEHTITRGNDDPNDDFVIRPGQTWCVISSAAEGDTVVTVYAPEINNWDHNRVFVKTHWCDARWEFPPKATVKAGGDHLFATRITRFSDRQPLAKYRVRYRLLDGPPAAVFTQVGQKSGTPQEAVAVSDDSGTAAVTVAQLGLQPGTNRVAIEVVRPPDPADPGSKELVVGRTETTIDWQAPQVALNVAAPRAVQVGQDVPVTFAVMSTGQVDTQPMKLRAVVPDGMQFVRSDPPARVKDGNDLLWELRGLPGGKQQTVQLILRPTRLGPVTATATVQTDDGLRSDGSAAIQVTSAQLQVGVTGPSAGVIDEALAYQITVTNPGSGPATNVKLRAQFDAGLAHASRANPFEITIESLEPGKSQTMPLTLTAKQPGQHALRVSATADGNLQAQATPITVSIGQPSLTLQVTGPASGYLNQEVTWKLQVANAGDVALSNVVLRAALPPEVTFRKATGDGKLVNGQVQWNLGMAPPRAGNRPQGITLELTVACTKLTERAVLSAAVTADPLVARDGTMQPVALDRQKAPEARAEAALEILGTPSLSMEVFDLDDPVEVGKRTTYGIKVLNAGTLGAGPVEVAADVPPQMKPVKTNGPTEGKIDGQRVTFAPLASVKAGGSATFVIEVEAVAPGDARFKAELRSLVLTSPLRAEEATRVLNKTAPPLMPSPPEPKR